MLWGGIIINADRKDGPLGMVQMLVHESAHNLLFGYAVDGHLVENDEEERYSSPLRPDPRPVEGIYHATFVVARMFMAVKSLLDSEVLPEADREQARRDIRQPRPQLRERHGDAAQTCQAYRGRRARHPRR